jgi:hypothetical protein
MRDLLIRRDALYLKLLALTDRSNLKVLLSETYTLCDQQGCRPQGEMADIQGIERPRRDRTQVRGLDSHRQETHPQEKLEITQRCFVRGSQPLSLD